MSEHRFLLRVPSDLWGEIAASAKRGRRSLNAEILVRLSGGSPSGPTDVQALLNQRGGLPPFLHVPDESVPTLDAVGGEGAKIARPVVPASSFRPDFGSRLKPGGGKK